MTVVYHFGNRHQSLEMLTTQFATPTWQMNQVHDAHVHVVQNRHLPAEWPIADALVTAQAGIALAVRTADCAPILLHTNDGIIAAVHSGRRGTFLNIIYRTVHTMRQLSPHSPITAYIGPCISQMHYPVGEAIQREAPAELYRFFDAEYRFNLPQAVCWQLKNCGVNVLQTHYECTYQNPDYASHRQGDAIRQYALIAFKT